MRPTPRRLSVALACAVLAACGEGPSPAPSGVETHLAGGQAVAAVSAPVTLQAATADALVTITPSVGAPVVGQPIAFGIDVTAVPPATGTPSGTVTVTVDGGTPFSLPLSTGHATFATSTLAVGAHLVEVAYSGDATFLPASGSLAPAVAQAATTVALATTPNPSTYGGAVTLTATIAVTAPGAGAPTGEVTFAKGATPLCGGPVAVSAGKATCAVATLEAGSHLLTATYGGDASFLGATSPDRTLTVGLVEPSVTVTTSGSPSTYGSPVTFTATVTGPLGAPTGAVLFTDGPLTLCGGPVALDAGAATCTTSATLPGTHFVTGAYQGDANHLASSAFVSHLVDPATPSVAASATPSPAVFGGVVTLSATVSGAGLVPSGAVQFVEGGTTLCSATLDGAGGASCTSIPLPAGDHAITAQYGGDADYRPAASAIALTVSPAPAAVALASSANPAVYAAGVTLTATVTGPGGTPGGQVTFRDGATILCGGPRPLAGGVATCSLAGAAGLAGGVHALTASYGGAANWQPAASLPLAQQVDRAAPVVALASSSPTSVYAVPVTFTATLSGAGVTPTGELTFTEGAAVLCGPVAAVAGVATCTTSALLRGSHTITATYGGDGNYQGRSASRIQAVTPAAPVIALLPAPSPSVFGQDVAIALTVAGPGITPTGSVTLTVGATQLCGGPLPLTDGAATCHAATLGAGDHLLVAAYSGDANYDAGAPVATTHHVDRALTEVALDAGPAAPIFGEPVVLTATVTVTAPGAGSPGGTVEFRDGATPLGTAPVDPLTGVATFTVPPGSPLAAGSHALAAVYSGDASFQGALSAALPPFVVGPASTLVAVTSGRSPSVTREPVTFTVDVTAVAPGAGTPSGTVTVRIDGGAPLALPLAGGTATFSTSTLPVGSHLVEAHYDGDASFLGADGSATQVVDRAATAVAVSTSVAPSVFGQPVTFTAAVTAVSPGGGTPGGPVRLLEGATQLAAGVLDAAGQARLTLATLPVGSHALTVEYGGDAAYLAGTKGLTHLVQPAFVEVQLAVSEPAAVYGQPVTIDVVVTPPYFGVGAPAGAVTLLDGAAVLQVLPLDAFGRAHFTTGALAPGVHSLSAAYPGGGGFHDGSSLPVAVGVRAAPVAVGLSTGPSPSLFGEPVAWTVQVLAAAPSEAIPDGQVQVLDGAAVLQTLTLDASGRASGGSAALPVGDHPLTARLLANPRFEATSSPAVSQVVAKAPASVLLAAAPSPSSFGAPVTLTARVAPQPPGAGAPTGLVTFSDGGEVLGVRPVGASGEATFDAFGLATGVHVLTASYAGDASFGAASALPLTHAVLRAGTAAVAALAPSTSVFGQPVAFSVTVTSTSGTPTGRVDLLDGGVTLLGSATLDAAGVATFTTGALAIGVHQVVASYAGDADHEPSAAPAVTALVQPAATTTALAAAPAAPVAGQPVTLTATVLPVAPGAGAAGGLVAFRDGATDLGTAAVDPITHAATLTVPSLPVGDHALVASYAGDVRFSASATDAPVALRVGKAGVAVTITTGPSPSVHGQLVTVTVTVAAAAPGAGTPSGQVTLTDGAASVGVVPLSGGAGQVTVPLVVGDHPLAADYAGDAAFLPGSGARLHVAGKALTDTTLVATPSPAVFGQAITLTATVRAAAPGAGSPDGAVTFKDGAAVLGTSPVGPGGVATLTTAPGTGTHALAAEYGGGAAFEASRGTAALEVVRAATAVAVVASPSPAEYGQPVAVTVTVTSSNGPTPIGAVTLADGAVTVAGPAALDTGGRAAFTLASPAAGVHALTASYAPAAGFSAASGGASLTVTAADTALEIASSRNPSRAGRPVTLIATATAAHATPGGTVTFKDGATVLGTAPLVAGEARLTTRALRKGSHPVTAQLAPASGFDAASATLAGGQAVENSPPVAGSGATLRLGPGQARRATAAAARALDAPAGTVELWARATWSAPGEAGAEPTLARLGGAAGDRWALGVAPSRTGLTVTLGGVTTTVPAALDDGAWHQIALAAGAASATVLVDGVEAGVVEGAFGPAPGETLTVGDGFVGEVDELRIWSATRSTGAVAADARRPLRATEPFLVGYWRMDEGEGLELFAGGPAAVDLAVEPDGGGAAAFGASGAWGRRVTPRERPLAPIDAGYDADGDALAVAIVTDPAHGTATADQPALQVGYLPAHGFSGEDRLAFRLTDVDGASGDFAVDLSVERILVCAVAADCSGGDVCAAGRCVDPATLGGSSGCGCASGGGGALALWSLLGLALARRRAQRLSRQGSAARSAATMARVEGERFSV